MALEGNSTALRRAINAANGGVDPNPAIPDQAHHLLSSSVIIELDYEHRTEAKKLMARAAGYKLNAASNGILLPTHFGHQRKLKLMRHRGNHWDEYYANVRELLDPIYDEFETLDVCKKDSPAQKRFLAALRRKETKVRNNIKRRKWWLYDWSQSLWKADYRDEGAVSLLGIGRPVTSADIGTEWLTKFAGDIKRRYKEVPVGRPTRNVVNKEWYIKHTYPAPKSLY